MGEHNALQFGQNISVNDLHIDAITDVRGNIDWKITVRDQKGTALPSMTNSFPVTLTMP